MTNVFIKSALIRNEEISGEFQLVKKYWNDSASKRDGRLQILLDGTAKTVQVFKNDFQYSDMELAATTAPVAAFEMPEPETEEEILKRITESFNAMDIFATGAINGHVKSLIISGAAGVGKTFTLERELNRAEENGEINFEKVAGTCSAIGLYTKLYECKDENSVLLLDDVDVFANEEQLNILKAALDTGEERIVSYNKASSWLEEKGIPNTFLFEGTVIFISNKDFDRELAAKSKMSPHFEALISRSIYLDLGVHTKQEILVRVKQIVSTTTMLTSLGLSNSQVDTMVDWISDNVDALRSLSLRTCLHIAEMMMSSPEQWEMLARMTMLKKVRK